MVTSQRESALPGIAASAARALSLLAALVLAASSTGCIAAIALQDSGPSGSELELLQAQTEPYLKKGSASISGVVTIQTASGAITAPPGVEVYLTPATTFAIGRLQEYVIEKNELPAKRESQLVLIVPTHADGRFRFQGLAPGDYIIACRVEWSPAGASDARADIAYARVHVDAGQSVAVTVSRRVSES